MLGIETGPTSDLYRVVLSLHILFAIAGFGGVLLNGLYAARAKERQGPEGRAISEANYRVSSVAEIFILLVPVTGLVLVWVSDGAWRLKDLWIWLSLVLYAVAFVISRAVLVPGHRRINRLLAEIEEHDPEQGPPPQVAAIEQAGRAMAMSGAILNVLLVALVALMIWKPIG